VIRSNAAQPAPPPASSSTSAFRFPPTGEQLSTEEADSIRREKNRIHAKLTRERKKLYMAAMEESIHQLDQEIKHMKEVVAAAQSAQRHSLSLPPFFPNFTVLHPFVPKNEVASARLEVA